MLEPEDLHISSSDGYEFSFSIAKLLVGTAAGLLLLLIVVLSFAWCDHAREKRELERGSAPPASVVLAPFPPMRLAPQPASRFCFKHLQKIVSISAC